MPVSLREVSEGEFPYRAGHLSGWECGRVTSSAKSPAIAARSALLCGFGETVRGHAVLLPELASSRL